jgi:hypothetical protein
MDTENTNFHTARDKTWIRADQIADNVSSEILRLRKRIEELEAGIEATRATAPPGTEKLAQGEDQTEIHFRECKVLKVAQPALCDLLFTNGRQRNRTPPVKFKTFCPIVGTCVAKKTRLFY